jgi:catechol 2,3-dioxygenase-like lactoylglutathione lyase family enzyme
MAIIDHIGLEFSDFPRALRFYRQALAPLGISVAMHVTKEETGNYEAPVWERTASLRSGSAAASDDAARAVAFMAERRAAVDHFFGAALAAGGVDNGEPNPRPHHPVLRRFP